MNSPSTDQAHAQKMDLLKYKLERSRFRADTIKWVAIAAGAVASFAVIDYGKLRLEQFRTGAEIERQMLDSYFKATESAEPDVWRRKLQVLLYSSQDPRIVRWAETELCRIRDFAGKEALYREAVKVASQLMERDQLSDPKRKESRARFEQLYWADLPLVGESENVEKAMVDFRGALQTAEKYPDVYWDELYTALIALSTTVGAQMKIDAEKSSNCGPPIELRY